MWERPRGVCHHAIVRKHTESSHMLDVIHWAPSGCKKIIIREDRIDLNKEIGTLYKIKYEKEMASGNPSDLVIKRASALLELEDYNFFIRNCENFARFCKTGISFPD